MTSSNSNSNWPIGKPNSLTTREQVATLGARLKTLSATRNDLNLESYWHALAEESIMYVYGILKWKPESLGPMTPQPDAILSPDQLLIQNSARTFEAETGHRANEYWDEFALWYAAQPKSEGGAMTAQQFLESRGLADLSIYWPTDKPIPQIDYESGQAKPTLAALMEALSAHNTAQLTKELAYMTEDRLSWRDQALKAKEKLEAVEKQYTEKTDQCIRLADRDYQFNRAETLEAELERLRSQGAQRSQCAPIGTEVKTWADYRQGCLDTYGGGHRDDGHLEAFRHGMETIFNLLEAEFPPAEVCKSARSQGAGPWEAALRKILELKHALDADRCTNPSDHAACLDNFATEVEEIVAGLASPPEVKP